MMLNLHRNHKAYYGRGKRGGEGGMEVGEEGDYIHIAVTTRMIAALRWAATRAILMFQ